MPKKLNRSDWEERLEKVHGGKIKLLEFGGTGNVKSKLKCFKGHTWLAHLSNVVSGKCCGCRKCGNARMGLHRRHSISKWKKLIKDVHGDEIKLMKFGGDGRAKSKLRCSEGHTWPATLASIVAGNGCPKCWVQNRRLFSDKEEIRIGEAYTAGSSLSELAVIWEVGAATIHRILIRRGIDRPPPGNPCSVSEWKKRIKEVHGNEIKLVKFGGNGRAKSQLKCCEGHTWFAQLGKIVDGHGCPKCNAPRKHSRAAGEWLDLEAKQRGIIIKHEYQIPGTPLWVDGFHKRSNTAFEYYGDHVHGNPDVYPSNDKPHPWNDQTAKQLFEYTKERAESLLIRGCSLVGMWQNDFPIRYDQWNGNYKVIKFTNRHGTRIRARDRFKTLKQALWMRDMAHHVLPDWTFDV